MRAIKLVAGGIACALLLSGCGEFYQPIAKDTVMVKKINQVMPEKKLEYPGVLSEDTVKTLSIDAVNRLFHTNLLLEDWDLEIKASDLQKVKSLLASITGDTKADPLSRYASELNAIPNGICRIIMTKRGNPYVQYIVVLNSKDGDILEGGRYTGNPSSSGRGTRINQEEAISLAKRFLGQFGDVNLEQLELGERTDVGNQLYGIIFFQDKETKNTRYVVALDLNTREVISFSKGIMTLLSYQFVDAPISE